MELRKKARMNAQATQIYLGYIERLITAANNTLDRAIETRCPSNGENAVNSLLDTMIVVRKTLSATLDTDFPTLKRMMVETEYDIVELGLGEIDDAEEEVTSDDTEA